MPKLLILSSNPRKDLNLDREVSDLVTSIQRVGKFEIELGLGCRPNELIELFTEHHPQIVHFCGHGAAEQGLVFQDENGQESLVSTEIIARLFKTFSSVVQCAVLNACDSEQQAIAIVEHIDYVIGMSQPILDKAAYYFATGFYQGLANGHSIEQSFDLGCLAIQIWSETRNQSAPKAYRKFELIEVVAQPQPVNVPEHLKPVLLKKATQGSSSLSSNPQVNTPPDSSPSNLPLSFVEIIQQEIDRKEYKDLARAAYDNFGQFSAATGTLTKAEYTQRQIVVNKVKLFWIEGFLKPSLQGVDALRLELEARPDAIANLTDGIESLAVTLDDSFDALRDTQIYTEMGQGRTLLILGKPGSGKTIALLQLAQRLLERSEQNLSQPIPIVFNLSSWAKERQAIVDWLIDELREKYQIPKALSEPWILQQQLILLLDGLDEVSAEYRNDCVRALNKFIGLFPQTDIAVCSRIKDYEALTDRLQISSALCLQPLSSKQIYQFLDHTGGALSGLKTFLKRNPDVEQFAQTPLILNLMSAAYQGWPVERLTQELSEKSDRASHLLNTYIDCRLDRGATSEYSKHQVLHWLSWLANRMVEDKQTIFLIEKIQPSHLNNLKQERIYQTQKTVFSGCALALIGMVLGWLSFGQMHSMAAQLNWNYDKHLFWLGGGLIGGLTGGLLGGIVVGIPKQIVPIEKLTWSWHRAKSNFVGQLFTGLLYGLTYGVFYGIFGELFFKWFFKQTNALIPGLILGAVLGLIGGSIFGLIGGLGNSEVEKRTIPNQGIISSLRNSIVVGLGLWLIVWLAFLLTVRTNVNLIFVELFGLVERSEFLKVFNLSQSIFFALINGFIGGLIGSLKYGGTACIQHFILRRRLFKLNWMPWNYAKFLDFTSKRLLTKKIGGGYVFFHRMLLEHFVAMPLEQKRH